MMLTYTIRRLLFFVPTFIGLLVLVFFMGRMLPGDPAVTFAGPEASQAEIENIRKAWGLDQPLPVQFGRYVMNITHGDMGRSRMTGRPVIKELAQRLPNSLIVTTVAMILAILGGVLIGVISAIRPYTLIDMATMIVALLLFSTPVFWLALMLILVFSLYLGWLPVFGIGSWRHMVLPAMSLTAGSMGIIARLTRSSMLEVLNEDHIRTAWAKGASESRVVFKHALRVALIPVITVSGLQFGVLLGGSVLIETIFSWPGIGKFMYDAILSRDYAALQATALIFALLVAIINLTVDLSYGVIDPRVRYE